METGALPRALGAGGTGGTVVALGNLLVSAGNLGSSVWANVQLQQVKALLSGLQFLTGAALAASVAGVGVSVAGFALVLRRLEGVEKCIGAVRAETLNARLATERVERRVAARDWARTESICNAARRLGCGRTRRRSGKTSTGSWTWSSILEGPGGWSYWPPIFCDPRLHFRAGRVGLRGGMTLAAAQGADAAFAGGNGGGPRPRPGVPPVAQPDDVRPDPRRDRRRPVG